MSELPHVCRRFAILPVLVLALFAVATEPAVATPSGQLTYAVHISRSWHTT